MSPGKRACIHEAMWELASVVLFGVPLAFALVVYLIG